MRKPISDLSSTPTASQTGTVDAPIDLSRPLLGLRNIEKVYETPAGKNYVLRRITIEVQPRVRSKKPS